MKSMAKTLDRKDERGSVLAYTVLSVLFLFFAVGLGVDLSHLYLAKTELQNSADAGALAGASALTLPNPERIAAAVDRAIDTMNLNKYNFNNIGFGLDKTEPDARALVTFAVNVGGPYVSETTAIEAPENIRFVRVFTPSVPINIFFAIPILGSARNLTATAVSGLSVPGNARYCPAPLAAVQCPPGDATCVFADQFKGVCPGADPHAIQTYPDGTTCDPTRTFCKGCSYNIRPAGSTGPSPGNLGLLRCAGTGCNVLRDALASYGAACACGNVSPGDQVPTQTGECAGPVGSGLNVRFDRYQPGQGDMSYSPDRPPDTNVAQGTSIGQGANQTWTGISWNQYQAGDPFQGPNPSHAGVSNRRVLVFPFVNVNDWPQGTGNVPAQSFGAFFMQNQALETNGDIRLEYIGENVSGVVGLDPDGSSTTNVVTPVLYR